MSVLAVVSMFGLVRGGFEDRFTPTVVQLDKARSPKVPFRNCDGRIPNEWCSLGRLNGPSSLLLWGDSHLMSYAPVLDKILAKQNIRGIFVPNFGCPPVLATNREFRIGCKARNLEVKNYLLVNPNIKTVVMAAYWSLYFDQDGLPTEQVASAPAKELDTFKTSFSSTIQWLRGNNIQAVLIGPVPVYQSSVPLGFAMEKVSGHLFRHTSLKEMRNKHAPFFDVVVNSKHSGGVRLSTSLIPFSGCVLKTAWL